MLLPDPSSTPPPVFTYLDNLIPVFCHEHVAILHRGRLPAASGAEYLCEGLRRGQWCCWVAPRSLHGAMVARLRQLGVDAGRHLAGRTLHFPAARDAGELLDWAQKFFADAEAAGAPAVRWLEEGLWAAPPGDAILRFFPLHARWNYLVKEYPCVALCHYDLETLEIPHLFSTIAVHRHLLVEGTLVRDNPFYIPAEKFVAMSPEERECDLREAYQEVGCDLAKLCSTLAGYGQLQRSAAPGF